MALDRRPVRSGHGRDPRQLDQPRPDGQFIARPCHGEFFGRERAVAGHADQGDADAEMGDDHAPDGQRRPLQAAPEQRRDAGRHQGDAERQPKARQQAHPRREGEAQRQHRGRSQDRRRHPAPERPLVPPPAQQRPDEQQSGEQQRQRSGDGVEIGRPDRQFLAAQRLGDDRVERADEDDAEDDAQQQIIDHQRAFAADRVERRAFADGRGARREQDQSGADVDGEQQQDEGAALRIDGEASGPRSGCPSAPGTSRPSTWRKRRRRASSSSSSGPRAPPAR